MSQQDRLIIFDTTLRDGEQSPGASMTKDEKVRIAKALEKMRVDVIEAGFAAASPGDFDSISARSEEHTSELQSRPHLVCRLLLEKKKRCLRTRSEWRVRGGIGFMLCRWLWHGGSLVSCRLFREIVDGSRGMRGLAQRADTRCDGL